MAAIKTPTILLIIDGPTDEQSVFNTIEALHKNEQINVARIIVICDRQDITESYFTKFGEFHPNTLIQKEAAAANISQLLRTLQTNLIGYIPRGTAPSASLPDITSLPCNFLAPWSPDAALPQETAKEMPIKATAWLASASLIKSVLPQLERQDSWTILEVAEALENSGIFFRWGAMRVNESVTPLHKGDSPSPLTVNSTILAVIPHYRCEPWLRRCLRSLVSQTRPLDGIVVVDDNSGSPPVNIVEEFPNVTLLTSPFNVGPYRLIQQVIEDTNYNAYLFQDADDWSTSDRLEKLLHAAVNTGAELVGTQEFRVFEEESRLSPVCYPLDVNAALAEKPGHPLLHPSSLVRRDLVRRIGGFATGLRFGGDTEFLLRAALVGRIVNVPYYCYFRRKRAGSLTTAADTGLDSPARIELLKTLKSRAIANYAALQEGQPPCLSPLAKEEPIKLNYVIGPKLPGIKQPIE